MFAPPTAIYTQDPGLIGHHCQFTNVNLNSILCFCIKEIRIKLFQLQLTDKLSPGLDKDDDFVGFLEDAFKTPIVINQDIQYGPVFLPKQSTTL
jgi:hypothetical protein